jgi:cysteine desulfurase
VRRHAPRAALHTDAVAAVPWLDVALVTEPFDLVSVSAHKFGGPKGVGALVVRSGTTVAPVLHGGSQERDRRPGTHDVAGIVGMAAALSVAMASRPTEVPAVTALRDRLTDGVMAAVPGVTETVGDRAAKVAGCCHLLVDGVDQEELLVLLDEAGICASAGAACASGALEPSHVLLAMGLSPKEAGTAVRFSVGSTTTADDIDVVVEAMAKIVERLRA